MIDKKGGAQALTSLSDLVRSTIADPETGRSDGDWYCRLLPDDSGGVKLYDLEYEGGRGVHTVRVQGARCRTLAVACETLANALEFPGYYGSNTDAFRECLFDLLDLSIGGLGSMFGTAPRPVESLILIIDTADQFLADEIAERASLLISLLKEAATERRSGEQAEFFIAFIGARLPLALCR